MKRMMGAVVALAACAAFAAGAARADTGWCGLAEGMCDSSQTYVQCTDDGTAWVLDQTWSASDFGAAICGGGYTVLQPPPDDSRQQGSDGGGNTLDLAPGMAPDPAQYVTEYQCPNGSIWAVASGDDFVCPAA